MAFKHWTDIVMEQVGRDLSIAKAAMQQAIGRPVPRQPAVRPQIMQAIANPEQTPPSARARLAGYLQEKYGEMAQNVLPYLGLDEEV